MLNRRPKTAGFIAAAALVGWSAAHPHAQTSQRRGATLAALITYAGFYQGQPVVVRGTLAARDQPVLMSPAIDRAVPLIFNGPLPADGPVELRASFWDVGRLQPEDPRIMTLGLDRLLPRASERDWPRPGEVVALVVSDAMAITPSEGEPTLRQIALDPTGHIGKRLKFTGQFRGRNLYGDVPQGPGLSQWDFVLRSGDSAIWVTGLRPRGKGFNLDASARVDTGNWLEAAGIVREGKGLVWVEAQQLALAKPEAEIRSTEKPIAEPLGPPPEVIFSVPTELETDVLLKAPIRLQFSRDMSPDSFKGRVRWRFTTPDAVNVRQATPLEAARDAEFKYDLFKRSLDLRLALDASAPYRDVVVELLDGITATDGTPLKPWTLRFSFGAQ